MPLITSTFVCVLIKLLNILITVKLIIKSKNQKHSNINLLLTSRELNTNINRQCSDNQPASSPKHHQNPSPVSPAPQPNPSLPTIHPRHPPIGPRTLQPNQIRNQPIQARHQPDRLRKLHIHFRLPMSRNSDPK